MQSTDPATPDTAGLRRLWSLELGPGAAGLVMLLSTGLLIASAVAFGWLGAQLHHGGGPPALVAIGVAVLLGFLLGIVAHEGVHATAFRALGKRPQFGAGIRSLMPYFYVTAPGSYFSRNQYLASVLAPFVILDLLGLALLVPAPTALLGFVLLVVNSSGSAGDLWMAGLLVQLPSWLRVEDTRGGFTAWAPAEHAGQAETPRLPVGLNPIAAAWIGGWLAASLACLLAFEFVIVLIAAGHPGASIRVGPFLLAGPAPMGRRGLYVQLLPLIALAAITGALLTVAWARIRLATRPR
jgi:hypothetical protein